MMFNNNSKKNQSNYLVYGLILVVIILLVVDICKKRKKEKFDNHTENVEGFALFSNDMNRGEMAGTATIIFLLLLGLVCGVSACMPKEEDTGRMTTIIRRFPMTVNSTSA